MTTTRARSIASEAAEAEPRERALDRELVLGLDVGGTKLAAGLVAIGPSGDRLSVLAERRARSDVGRGPAAMLDELVRLGRATLADVDVDPGALSAVGIACGGPLDPVRGVIQGAHFLPGWDDVPITAIIAEAFGARAVVDNDATAAAIAEHRFGAGRGVDDLVYLTISTGIGGGAISGGRPVRGATGNGAELGHLLAVPGGRRCACGRMGCLQAEASGSAIAERAVELGYGAPGRNGARDAGGNAPGSEVEVTAEWVAAAAVAGDPIARRAWDDAMAALAAGVVNAANAFDPELVILGGGVTRAGERLFEPVRRALREQAMPPTARNARVVAPGLGDELAVVSAAAVAIDRLGLPRDAGTAAALDQLVASAEALRLQLPQIDHLGNEIADRLLGGGRLVAFGNGGSAAEAQHLVAELVGRYRRSRPALPAVALTADTATLTAIANDFAWEDVFARQIGGTVGRGDVVVAISTSGEAENVLRGVRAARANGALAIALTGGTGGRLAAEADRALVVPPASTARIQELHAFVVHALSEIVDRRAADHRE